jgi:hypothetical protein
MRVQDRLFFKTTRDLEMRVPQSTNIVLIYKAEAAIKQFLRENCYREPGEYGFNESTKDWNKIAQFYEKNGYYTIFAEGTTDYKEFWDKRWVVNVASEIANDPYPYILKTYT